LAFSTIIFFQIFKEMAKKDYTLDHANNPIYSGGKDQENRGSRLSEVKS
jgi:hypothetical protein